MVGPFAGFAAKRAVEFLGGHLMGLGYTSGAYTGYGVSNTIDPLGIHGKGYRPPEKLSFEMPYGSSYGRRRYSRYSRYGRRSRYSGYTRYSRYSRRRRYRRSYRRYSRFY